ncbi:antibiotic biosynthesis monooxygenase family protein [Rhodopila sp.]|jgi:heme-degrading monooxygenase HmoA|uniref:antibiotic biosynthesis monooxygenase family protein n=1 Tax=Rhodopila sp. TaxID=2480087 RepID=UPI002D000A66|nr:antibiotic biosynthesis monooxygenase [Rhodopila sp.]HVZ08859.1 antibiotic biosynthesis monooxygenase [Rhodopila sp.]
MFSVIFEVQPHAESWDAYMAIAGSLRPELERMDGFIDNIRYRSLTRPGWLLSLSCWRDEKALVRWRTQARHHAAQAQGRDAIFQDYHLRVGQVVADTQPPPGHTLREQRLDETEVGDAPAITLVDAPADTSSAGADTADSIARRLGWAPDAYGLVGWDVFDAVLTPGAAILMLAWHDRAAADAFRTAARLPSRGRLRQIRVVRDYGLRDRREAPQYFADPR